MDFKKRLGGATALYDAVYHGLNNALDYRENLENSGVETKTMVFVITDGEDNSSKKSANTVKTILKKLKADEGAITRGVGQIAGLIEKKQSATTIISSMVKEAMEIFTDLKAKLT